MPLSLLVLLLINILFMTVRHTFAHVRSSQSLLKSRCALSSLCSIDRVWTILSLGQENLL